MWKGAADSKKTKRLSQEEIKKQLLESIIINEAVESEELNREAEEVQDPKEAAMVIQSMRTSLTRRRKESQTSRIKERFLKSLRTKRNL